MIDYNKDPERIIVRHLPTGETYEAILLDDRYDKTCIFQITGSRKDYAKSIVDNDNMEVDTLFNKNWVVVRKK